MQSKTKIIVLHSKELIYTGIFITLGILLILLLIFMFTPDSTAPIEGSGTSTMNETANADQKNPGTYVPGVYTTSIMLNNAAVDIEVVVDKDHINSIRLVNLNEAVAAIYPLIQPTFDELTAQIYKQQSIDSISYLDENKYTSILLIDAIGQALDKARPAIP
ncbi:MAG: hypothetical protein GX567_01965 [Clostridia bacterium]|nr:hypothetical protein [Clostridia bacterium]